MKHARILFEGAVHDAVEADGQLRLADGRPLQADTVSWLPPLKPVARPRTILALGLNYADHAKELAFKAPEEPLVFVKGESTLTGHRQLTYRPADVQFMHYECELVIMVGKTAKKVRRDDAYDFIGGYTVANDYAIRDYLENWYRPNLRVKNRDTCTPIGPWLVDAKDVADPMALALSTTVNGKLTQSGNTKDMIFDAPFLIEYFSSFMTLQPGDLILTGTPDGVVDCRPGDVIVTEIAQIGALVNTIAAAEMKKQMETKLKKLFKLATAMVALAASVVALDASAQSYPTKPVRWVVGYPAGGGTDFLARTAGAQLSQQIGQPVLVDNRPGASAIIASENVARSPSDGYTVFSADNGVLVYNPVLYRKLPYDAEKDFVALGMMGRSPLIITAAPGAGFADAKALIAALKKAPGHFSIATPGAGSPHHLALELFQREAGVQLLHVPYKGGAPALQDLMGGQVPLMMLDLPSGISAVKAGKVVPLLAMSGERVPQLPQVPTAKELGFGEVEAYTWQGLVAPAATPKDIQLKLGTDLLKAMNDPAVRQKLFDAGWEARPTDAAEMNRYVQSERKKWQALIASREIRID